MGGTPRQRKLKQKHGGVLLTGLSSLLPSSTLEGVTLPTGMGPSHIPQASLEGGDFLRTPSSKMSLGHVRDRLHKTSQQSALPFDSHSQTFLYSLF